MPKFFQNIRPPKPRPVLIYVTLLVLFIISAAIDHTPRKQYEKIDLSDSCYAGLIDKIEYPTEEEILADGFTDKLKLEKGNLSKRVGFQGRYIWVKATFTLTEALKDKDLGLFVTFIHFADKVWLNGSFIGSYGAFPPDEMSSQYLAHAYYFPKTILNQNGENTIMFQVWVHGVGTIAGKMFVSEQAEVKRSESYGSFKTNYVYIYFQGGMFASFLLFLFLFLRRKHQKEYFFFSMLCFVSIIFSGILFAPTNPYFCYTGVKYFKLYRTTLCFMGLMIFTLLLPFVRYYIGVRSSGKIGFSRFLLIIFQFVVLYSTKNYNDIMKVSPLLFGLNIIHILLIAFCFIAGFKQSNDHRRIFTLMLCFSPFVLMVFADFIVRGVIKAVDVPFLSYFGWQLTIIAFLLLLSHNYSQILEKHEYLNKNLLLEVNAQTENLRIANEMLEDRIERSEVDLKMASIVQQKIFPYPNKNFVGWDIAVLYEPLTEVSGDFYDYYNMGNILDGISIFDVSGHGVAASLVTMLAKNIVYNSFKKNRFYDVPMSKCLLDVNHDLIVSKGSIENYMTGIMMRFSRFNDNDDCTVDFANAGHPRPILYSAEKDVCEEIVGDETIAQFGAIGMKDVDVTFRDVNITMKKDDILVCYTDGITEAKSEKHELFGKRRLMNIIKENHTKDAHRLLQAIQLEYTAFVGEAPREDDVTIFVLKREDPHDFLEALDSE